MSFIVIKHVLRVYRVVTWSEAVKLQKMNTAMEFGKGRVFYYQTCE